MNINLTNLHNYYFTEINKINDENTKSLYTDAIKCLDYDSIMYIGLYNSNNNEGFLWSNDDKIIEIMNIINRYNNSHSGASISLTMSWIQKIYKQYIYEQYVWNIV